ncbi:VWA domain-containing protein [Mesorhizobium yinganensis]|uniref:VWA domain-containing protein n=1 Tax=Mesorhizobium yinganensis TaxID=3157707 RepID=UPI0032B86B34
MIADFHFLRPWWLLALIAAVALPWLLARQTDVRTRWRGMIAPNLLDHLVVTRQAARHLHPVHLTAAAIALGAIATAGPTWERERPPFVEDTAPLAIVVDLSQTMDATDISPSRLERAKLKVQDILDRRKGARTAVFAYAGSAHMVLPLTDDAALIKTYAASLATRLMPVPGKDTAKALQAAEAGLANEGAPGTILFLTDGVEQAALNAFSGYRGRQDLIVLGIGTAEGGPVKIGDSEYLTDSAGARVFAKLDVDALKELQRQSSVQVATVTADDADVEWIVRRIQTAFQQKAAEGATRWRDMGWWLTIPIAALGAFWFRRGWSVQWSGALLAVVLLASPDWADAAEWSFADMWLTPDQQGRFAFERGDYAGAAERFRDPAWRGVALYRAEKFDEALDAFAQSGTAEAYYNQGNVLMHLARPEQAVAAYGQALKARPDWADAKTNLAVAEALAAAKKKDDEEQEAQDPNEKPDKIQFDDKGKKGKAGTVDAAQQTADMWMRNIQVTPADLLARKFAIEAKGGKP